MPAFLSTRPALTYLLQQRPELFAQRAMEVLQDAEPRVQADDVDELKRAHRMMRPSRTPQAVRSEFSTHVLEMNQLLIDAPQRRRHVVGELPRLIHRARLKALDVVGVRR